MGFEFGADPNRRKPPVHVPVLLAALLLASDAATPPAPELLSFQEFFEPSPSALRPSARLLKLVGRRVRLVGYMARMESPPRGGFFLCASPVLATEAGGGTADLPPDAVLVVVRSAAGKELAHIPRPLEVTGVLELSPRVDDDGRVSRIRVVLDGPAPGSKTEAPRRSGPTSTR
jgi:hypothetical protein